MKLKPVKNRCAKCKQPSATAAIGRYCNRCERLAKPQPSEYRSEE